MRASTLLRAVLLFALAAPVQAAIITVDTTSDPAGPTACTAAAADCTLRGAILMANSTGPADTIAFAIPMTDAACVPATGVCTITLTSNLPPIFGGGATLIDATTQANWQPNTLSPAQGGLNAQLKIVLSAVACPACNGLNLSQAGSGLKGMVMRGFATTLTIDAPSVFIEGCYIGTEVSGNSAPAPGDFGIVLGGNQFSGAGHGGIRIGGTLPAQRNLISGHNAEGLKLLGYSVQVLGNLIGTNAAGTAALGNRIGVQGVGGGTFRFLIGDGTPAGRNLISGNRSDGVQLAGPECDTLIHDNFIGTDISGELPLGNSGNGVQTAADVAAGCTFGSQIGGVDAAKANRIRFNAGGGVLVGRPRNPVRGNLFGRNGALGIGTGNSAVRQANDVDDADLTPFNQTVQNFPDISAFAINGASVDLSYRVDSTTGNSAYPLRIEFFKADGDEGAELVGIDSYLAPEAQTVKAISLPIPPGITLGANDLILATATDANGNTSEFGFHVVDSFSIVADAPDPSVVGMPYTVSVRADAAAGTLFKPNGTASIADGRGRSCVATLTATATPLRSEGQCDLASVGAAGNLTLTASYSTLGSAFATASGASIANATASHALMAAACIAGQKTWDGGGATSNWSDAANWTCDALPTASDTVIFDGTNSKNATVNLDLSLNTLQINAGYSGTISQGAFVVSLSGAYTQAAGTFGNGSGAFTVNGAFQLTGGVFDATTGTFTFNGSLFARGAAATFNHHDGTLILAGNAPTVDIVNGGTGTQAFGNLTVNSPGGLFNSENDTLRVLGTLNLLDGSLFSLILDAQGAVNVGNSWGSGSLGEGVLQFSGSATRTIQLPVLPEFYDAIVLDAANTTVALTGAGEVKFTRLNLIAGTLSGGSTSMRFNRGGRTTSITGGVLDCGSGLVSFDEGAVVQSGGVVNCQNAAIGSTTSSTVAINGGVFNAPTGTATFNGGTFTRGPAGTFNHDNGTVVFGGNVVTVEIVSGTTATQDFGNLTVNTASGLFNSENDTLRVLGTLNLVDGALFSLVLESQGGLVVANTWGIGSDSVGEGVLLLSGSATRSLTLPVLPNFYNKVVINAPNTTVSLGGVGEVKLSALDILAGTLNAATTNLRLNRDTRVTTQSGGVFNCGSGTVTFDGGSFTQTGGTADCQSATISSVATLVFKVNGGTFNAPSGSLTLNGGSFERGAAGTFNHNDGTVVFAGNSVSVNIVPGAAGTQDFRNLTVNTPGGVNGTEGDTLRATGTLSLSGQGTSINLEAQGDVLVPTGFGGNTGVTLAFTGTNNQVFSNTGSGNAPGTWTINKAAGTVTAATSLLLLADQTLNINSGTLLLANGSNLSTGPLNLGAGGRLVNESATTITLGGTLSNAGVVDLQGGGAQCPQADSILIRSTDATSRSWNTSGSGRYRLVDVDVQRMVGTGVKTVFSGTDSGNNNTSWVFDTTCPPTLSLTPSSASVQTGANQAFAAGGGFTPYVFSIATNGSGATINPGSGLYTAGATAGVTDVVRVTDFFGTTADATVTTFGVPDKLTFSVQPGNTVAGLAIAPALQVAIRDAGGNLVSSSTLAVTMAILDNAGNPPGTLTGTLVRNAVAGIATFDDLRIDRVGSNYRLRTTSGALFGADSNPFAILVGPASRLQFVIQPTNTPGGSIIAPPPKVTVQDASGNTITNASQPITIELAANPGAGLLSGTLVQSPSVGSAQFDNLSINNAGVDYSLRATSGTLISATSDDFDILDQFQVTNTNNAGAGSLRQAIINANATAGTQTVSFNLSGVAPFTIAPTTSLPIITQPIVIDGSTQPGFTGMPIIELDGQGNLGLVGLDIEGGASTIKGLAINRFNIGVIVSGSAGNTIQGNFIGINAAGNAARGNIAGILMVASSSNLIGGSTPAARNIISGNQANAGIGIHILAGSSDNLIQGNFVGTDLSGTAPVPNFIGIRIVGGERNLIGGSNPADANKIAFNSGPGTFVRSTDAFATVDNHILGNAIVGNGGTGIDLFPSGVTQNDSGDADSGPNNLQNFPVLSSALTFGGNTVIEGSLNSTPSQSFAIHFYSSAACDASGHGEGESILGSTNVTTDASGIVAFTANLPGTTTIGRAVTATATDLTLPSFSTSEFSACRNVVAGVFSISGRIVDGANNPIANVNVVLQGARRSALTDSNGQYIFNDMPGGSTLTIVPNKANHSFVPATRTFPNISANQSNQGFVGTEARFRISGQVSSSIGGSSFALSGVSMNLSGTATALAITDANGNYAFNDLTGGVYLLTPIKSNFTLTPTSSNLVVNSNQTVNYGASLTPPLTGRVVYLSGTKLFGMNADGSAKTPLVDLTPGATCNNPALSRDGRKVVFRCIFSTTSVNGQGDKLYRANSDGSGLTVLTSNSGATLQDFSPAWSPNGSRIAFVRRTNTGSGYADSLRTMNADGTGLTTVYSSPINDLLMSPSWSADGSRIVFSRSLSARAQIFAINANGTQLTQLTSTAGLHHFAPSYSPDGTKILFRRSPFGFSDGFASVMNADGSGRVDLASSNPYLALIWAPDGTRLAFVRQSSGTPYGVMNVDGSNAITVSNGVFQPSWSVDASVATAVGAPVNVGLGATTVNFSGVTTSGVTTFTPIPAGSAGSVPGGFAVGSFGTYEVATTAAFTAPVTVCFTMPSTISLVPFNRLAILHNEGGVLVDRTSSRNFAIKQICSTVSSLSPFAIAEAIDAGLPRISGLVHDAAGQPMAAVAVRLSGEQARVSVSDSNGLFVFPNLVTGAGYNVKPTELGYLFDAYSQDFPAPLGEQSAVFEGTPNVFAISGRVVDSLGAGMAGVTVELSGPETMTAVTDAVGGYAFADLPADGFYQLQPVIDGNGFDPPQQFIDPLTGNVADVDFTVQAFLPDPVFASGFE